MDRELIRLGIEKRYCVFNKVKGDLLNMGVIPGIASVSRDLRMNVAGIIQYDDNILISATHGVPIVMKEDSYITRNMERIADRILED